MFGGEKPDMHKEVVDGKEITVVQLHHQPHQTTSVDEDTEELYNIATVAYHFPQYTLKQLYEEVPAYQVKAMIKVARAEQAQQLLLMQALIHGPNQKKKDGYKKLVKKLQEQAKLR